MKTIIFLKTSAKSEVDDNIVLNSIFWLLTSDQTKCFGLLFPWVIVSFNEISSFFCLIFAFTSIVFPFILSF